MLAAVVESKNSYLGCRDGEGNRYPSFEADNTQASTYVVTPLAAFTEGLEAQTIDLETFDVVQRYIDAGTLGDPVAQMNEVISRFRRESNGPTSQRRALCFAV